MKNNKKHGASSKTWAIDCRIDSAFDFALKVLREAKNTKYPLNLRINFVRIAYNNSLETIAKAQTDPKEFKLKTALKILNTNLSQISKVAINLLNEPINIPDKNENSECANCILNPYDYIDIDYKKLEDYVSRAKRHPKMMLDENNVKSCATRYNFPKVFEDVVTTQNYMSARLLPTNDIIISIPLAISVLFRIPLDIDKYYSNGHKALSELKVKPFIELIENEIYFTPSPALLHVPYDSFLELHRIIDAAIKNPQNVKEIGITIYRLSSDSDIINSLIAASNLGIKCKIYIELSARGEIDQDLYYLTKLLNNGNREYLDIKLQYNGIKVHAKMMYIALADRQDCLPLSIGIFSTGNYNDKTAAIYKDYHYISCEQNVIEMIQRNFSVLWNSDQPVLSSISNVLSKEIYEELSKGSAGKIWIQTNHLDNKHIVNLLREAIRRGCDVKLIVRTTRGFHNRELKNCKTVVGKYLEHARVYIFGDSSNRRVYLSSSDILFRNLYNRFESYVKITNKSVEKTLVDDFRDLYKNGQK